MRKIALDILGDNYIQQALALTVVYGSGIILGLLIIAARPSWWFAFLFAVLALVLFINHKIGVFLLFISIFLVEWVAEFLGLLPRQFTWFTEIILIILLGKVLFLKLLHKGFQRTVIDKWVFLLICSGVIGAVINEMHPVVALLGFRNFFKYIVMFYILLNLDLDEKFLKIMLKLLIITAVVQIPVTVVEWQLFGVGDSVVGTLGRNTTGVMAIYLAFVASFLIGFYMHTGNLVYLLTIILLFIPIILGSGRFGFLLIPASVIFSVFFAGKINIQKLFKLASVTVVAFLTLIGAVRVHDQMRDRGDFYEFLTSPEKMYLYTTGYTKSGTLNRTEAIIFASNLLSQSPWHFLFGYGPGNASPSFFRDYEGALETQYKGLRVRGVQLSWVMLEFGSVGLLLFVLIYSGLFRSGQALYASTKDQFWKAICVGYNGVVFAYLVSVVYMASWIADVTAFAFWLISAAIVAKVNRMSFEPDG